MGEGRKPVAHRGSCPPRPLAGEGSGERVLLLPEPACKEEGSNHAFILHSRPYKESSALVDVFSPQGRIRAVLRRARTAFGGIAQPFIRLEMELRGRGELKTLSRLESLAPPLRLGGERLFSALYLNELLMRLLPQADAHPQLFEHYQQSLELLAANAPLEPVLRRFEWQLLDALGYGFALDCEQDGTPLEAAHYYRLHAEGGLQRSEAGSEGALAGHCLLALSRGQWSADGALSSAKRLMRRALAAQLGSRPLKSRELFIRPSAKVSAHV